MYAQFDHAGIFADNLRASWDDFKDVNLGPVEQFAWCQAASTVCPGSAPHFELIGARQLHEPMDFVYSGRQPLATLCNQEYSDQPARCGTPFATACRITCSERTPWNGLHFDSHAIVFLAITVEN